MHNWFEIALLAYLVGASIEGVNTSRELYHSLGKQVKNLENDSNESAELSKGNWLILAIIAVVSIAGAISWPCRLIHRSMKEKSIKATPERSGH